MCDFATFDSSDNTFTFSCDSGTIPPGDHSITILGHLGDMTLPLSDGPSIDITVEENACGTVTLVESVQTDPDASDYQGPVTWTYNPYTLDPPESENEITLTCSNNGAHEIPCVEFDETNPNQVIFDFDS